MLKFTILAQSKQDDILKSISDNVSQSGDDSGHLLIGIVIGIAVLIILATLFNLRTKRQNRPKVRNHPGKLVKELVKELQLRPVEFKQLKLLAQGEQDAGNPIENPLVFLLCPSAFANAARAQRVKVDRKAMAGLARKMGLIKR